MEKANTDKVHDEPGQQSLRLSYFAGITLIQIKRFLYTVNRIAGAGNAGNTCLPARRVRESWRAGLHAVLHKMCADIDTRACGFNRRAVRPSWQKRL